MNGRSVPFGQGTRTARIHRFPRASRCHSPPKQELQFVSGAVCGQVIMSAVDTVATLAMSTSDRAAKGTVYQHTHFLRPALSEICESRQTSFGSVRRPHSRKRRSPSSHRVSWWRMQRVSSRFRQLQMNLLMLGPGRCPRSSGQAHQLPCIGQTIPIAKEARWQARLMKPRSV